LGQRREAMSDRSFKSQEIIDSTSINLADVRCPKCNNNTLLLDGTIRYSESRILENGQISFATSSPPENEIFEIEVLGCMSCGIEYILKQHELFILEQDNAVLRTKLNMKPKEITN
jgi:hypothetical protein